MSFLARPDESARQWGATRHLPGDAGLFPEERGSAPPSAAGASASSAGASASDAQPPARQPFSDQIDPLFFNSDSKTALYVGGLPDEANEQLLLAAFSPFGPLRRVQIPVDMATDKHRGFGFVQFLDEDDAEEAIFNMDGAELHGRSIRVNATRDQQKLDRHKPVWDNADAYFEALQAQKESKEQLQAQAKENILGRAAQLPQGPLAL